MITPISLKNSKIAVFGLGKAGTSTIQALCRAGAEVYAWDDGEKSRISLESKGLQGVTIISPEKTPWAKIKLLALSPGIPLTHPKPHRVVELANDGGCPIICDIELLYEACKEAKFIGITGTNGKSTTTTLIGHILRNSGIKAQVGGNIGIPALDLTPLAQDGVYVLEMSSYQLDLIKQTHFNISVFLNVTKDHIDRHGDIQGYVNAKYHIFDNQQQNDVAIIGVDDEYTNKIYEKLKSEGKIGRIIPISTNKEISGGILVKNGVIYDNSGNSPKEYELGQLKYLPGKHNSQNIAAAFASCAAVGVPAEKVISAIKSFEGLRHRMQLAAEIDGVKFVNDSKATNADAAANALLAFDNIYWILGGLAKEGGIESLEELFPKINHAFLIGKAQDDFANTLEGKAAYSKCETLANAFSEATKKAFSDGKKGSVILLSPACASWDQWASFEARGDAFCEMADTINKADKIEKAM